MIKEAIIKLSKKEDLAYAEAEQVMNEIMEGKASEVQMSAYLTALSMKGETIDEITASASGMRAHCVKPVSYTHLVKRLPARGCFMKKNDVWRSGGSKKQIYSRRA